MKKLFTLSLLLIFGSLGFGQAGTSTGTTTTTLNPSGVTAGTCGDATHVCQVTSNSQGIVTGATPVAISSGGGGGGGSSFQPDIWSDDKPPGVIKGFKAEHDTIAPGATETVLNYSGGDGYISEFLVVVQSTDQNAREQAVLNVYYNNETTPSISGPAMLLFGGQWMDIGSIPKLMWASPFTITSWDQNYGNTFTYSLRIPIPFQNAVKVTLTNVSTTTNIQTYDDFKVHTGVPDTWPNGERRLRAYLFHDPGCSANAVENFVDSTAGAGRYAGMWFMFDANNNNPGYSSVQPDGRNPHEGNFKIYLDGATTPTEEWSGTEDYFNLGAYGEPVTQVSNTVSAQYYGTGVNLGEVGTAFRNTYGQGTYGYYRFHRSDPIVFNSEFKLTWNCGDTSESNFTGNPIVWSTLWIWTAN